MDCLFLGGMLASSSTTIIIRAFDELGVKNKSYSRIVFGVLVVEDIVVILLMVLLSTIAVTQHIEGMEMLLTVGKLLFFLIIWFVLGIYLIPSFLKKIKSTMDDEGYLVLSIGLCLMMVVVAVNVGFSAELGAFIMGSILAETTSAEKIEHITKPVKDLFGAIFFVSVGMMIDPKVIIEYGWIVFVVTMLVIFGKLFSTALGAILSGQSLKQSIQVGSSMAQIGEFAFIVATLGMTLGVISDFLFPVAVGASAITTFTTPYMIKYSNGIYRFTERILPKKWLTAIKNYSESTQTIQAESEWKLFVKSYLVTLMTNGILLLAIFLLGSELLFPLSIRFLGEGLISVFITLGITLLVASPFIWAFMFKMPNNVVFKDLWVNHNYNNGPLLALGITRLLIALCMTGYFVFRLFPSLTTALIVVPIVLVGIILASRHTRKLYENFENRFMSNLNSREIAQEERSSNIIKKEFGSQIKQSSWDINIVDFEIDQNAEYAGKFIEELTWREEYGINIVYIKRGERLIYAPGPAEKLFPFDHIGVVASDEELEKFLPIFNKKTNTQYNDSRVEDIIIEKIIIDDKSQFLGVEIKNSGIREQSDALVVGIERGKEHFMNPGPNTVFKFNDIVWIVGERKKLQKLKSVTMFSND